MGEAPRPGRWHVTPQGLSLTALDHAASARGVGELQAGLALSLQGNYRQALARFASALQAAQEAQDWELEGAAHFRTGQQWQNLRDYGGARTAFIAALAQGRALPSRQLQMQALRGISDVLEQDGSRFRAVAALEESLAIARSLGDTYSQRVALTNLAGLYRRQGRLQDAVDIMASETTNAGDDAYTLLSRANSAWLAGDVHESIQFAARGARTAQELGLAKPLRIALANLHNCHTSVGDLVAAADIRRRIFQLLAEDGRKDVPTSDCSICLEDIEDTTEVAVVPYCYHMFCRACLERVSNRCAICTD